MNLNTWQLVLLENNHQAANIMRRTQETKVEKGSNFRRAEFGRKGYASGGGSMHSSPLK